MHPMNPLSVLRRRLASLLERFRASVHALLVLRVLGAAVVVVVLAWVGGRSPVIPGALAQEGAPAPEGAPVADRSTDASPSPSLESGPHPRDDAASRAAPARVDAAPGTAPACVCDEARTNRTSTARASPSDPVDVNAADEGDLRRLPGVGAKRAEAILALRRKLGRFRKIEDLLRVKGIGRATLRRWRPLVRLEGSTSHGAGVAGVAGGPGGADNAGGAGTPSG